MKKSFFIGVLFALFVFNVQAKEYPSLSKSKPVNTDLKGMTASCQMGTTVTEISLNNARTWVFTTGLLWTDISGGAGYEIPKNSQKTSLYSGGIWIGGTDVNGQLKISAIL